MSITIAIRLDALYELRNPAEAHRQSHSMSSGARPAQRHI